MDNTEEKTESLAIGAPRIVSSRPREREINLDWPVEFSGRKYIKIIIRRLTAAEVAKFQSDIEALLKSDPSAQIRFPLFRDDCGALIPNEVMDALDDDDRFALEAAAADFLPRRFLGAPTQESGQVTGGNTERSF